MEMLFILSSVAAPIALLILVWLITGKFAWAALSALVFIVVIKIFHKKLGYGKTVLLELAVLLVVFVGDHVRVEFLNDSRKRAAVRQEKAAEEKAQAEHEARRVEAETLRQKKRDLVRGFALKEAPSIWEAFQALESERETVKTQAAELKKTLESFNKNADDDNDYKAAMKKLAEINQTCHTLWRAMERAYIQYCKFKASAGDAELAELSKNATAAAVKEADAAKERYRDMLQVK